MLVYCISVLPLYELTTPANAADSSVVQDILCAANKVLPVRECIFGDDKGYDVKDVYNLIKDVYEDEAFISLNKRNTKDPKQHPPAIQFAMQSSPYTRTTRSPMDTEACARRFAALSGSPNQAATPVIAKIGTTARKTGAVSNTKQSLQTTGFQLTGNAPASSKLMLCARNTNTITPALKLPGRNVFEDVMAKAPPV